MPLEAPYSSDAVLYDSSIFKKFENQDPSNRFSLPSPAAVREEATRQHGLGSKHHGRPPPVKYPSLGLIVKYGSMVSVAEAHCLAMIRKHLPLVPVPEVYGWHTDGRMGFIYMELVEGKTLEECWDDLTQDDKLAVCSELHDHVAAWRRLPQSLFSDEPFVGNIDKEELLDWIFVNSCSVGHGPFASVADFHVWYTEAYGPRRLPPWEPRSPHPYRRYLPDNVPIVFTHADLHPSNIIIAHADGAPRIAAVIDWQQSGWYPDYWEYCKSRWAWCAKAGQSWTDIYLPKILDADKYNGDCYNYWDYFALARGV